MTNAMRRSGDKVRRKKSRRPEGFIVPTNGSVGCGAGSGKGERGAGFRLGDGQREGDSCLRARSLRIQKEQRREPVSRTPRKRFGALRV